MTPTRLFVDQIARAREAIGFVEREVCRVAGIKSKSQIGRSRTGSPMQWDHVAAIATVLERDYSVRREWLLWGEGPMVRSGALVRGPGAPRSLPPPVRVGQGAPEQESATDPAPRPGKHARGAKRSSAR